MTLTGSEIRTAVIAIEQNQKFSEFVRVCSMLKEGYGDCLVRFDGNQMTLMWAEPIANQADSD